MRSSVATYRVLLRLYPRRFRREFEEDMVQLFCDLADRDGVPSTWRRTIVDLAVTVPRYRLETIMNVRQSSVALSLFSLVGAITGIALLTLGTGTSIAVIVLVLVAAIALAQRGRLARSLRPDNAAERRHLWLLSAIAAVVAIAVLVIGLADLGGEDHWPAGRLLIYNLAFFIALLTAVISFAVGLRRPRME